LLISLSIAFISVAPEARKSFTCIASLLISFRLKSARTNRAFAFFKGTCTRGIYDNMNTAVETVFIGKDRQFNPPLSANVWPLPGRANRLPGDTGM
jgi:hypothetical protein